MRYRFEPRCVEKEVGERSRWVYLCRSTWTWMTTMLVSMPLVATMVLAAATSTSAQTPSSLGDLAIGFDVRTHRPNAFIAWRNSQRILEVEVEAKNLGDRQSSGRVLLSILDQVGRTLADNAGDEPQRVSLPPKAKGGEDGVIVRVKGNLALNLLIDQLDRRNQPYLLAVSLASDDADANLSNNSYVKSFNTRSRLRPAAEHYQEYSFLNTLDRPMEIQWDLATSSIPEGWTVRPSFKPGECTRLESHETATGFLSVLTSRMMHEGQHVDLRVVGRDCATDKRVHQYEWYAVYDGSAPSITDVERKVMSDNGSVVLTATVNDGMSMLKEASGVRVEYSTDGGLTYSTRIMAYAAGNFVGPTSFNTTLGPFAPGTEIVGNIIASDIADNIAEYPLGQIVVPATTAGRLDSTTGTRARR